MWLHDRYKLKSAIQAPWKYSHHKYITNTQRNPHGAEDNRKIKSKIICSSAPCQWHWPWGSPPNGNFGSNWVISRDQSDARCKLSREDRKGKRKEDSESDTGAICRVREFVQHIKLFKSISMLCVVGASWEGSRKVVGCIAGIRTKDWPVVYRHYKTHGWSSTMWTDEDTRIDMEPGTETPRTSNIWPAGRSLVQVPLWIWLILVSCSFTVDISLRWSLS